MVLLVVPVPRLQQPPTYHESKNLQTLSPLHVVICPCPSPTPPYDGSGSGWLLVVPIPLTLLRGDGTPGYAFTAKNNCTGRARYTKKIM